MHWKSASLGAKALLVGLLLTLPIVGAHAATSGGKDCVPAEPPMGSARQSLDGRNKDGGLHAQDHAIDELERCLDESKRDAKRALDELNNTLSNLQSARPGQSQEDQDDGTAELNELGDIIRRQQQLLDKTYKQGQDQRRRQRGQPGQNGQPEDKSGFGELQKNQQALRDRLKQEMEKLRQKGFGQQPGQGQNQGQAGEPDPLGEAHGAMDEAQGSLGDQNADGAVESQQRALEALRKGAQSLAQEMQKRMQMGEGQGTGDPRRPGRPRADQDTDPFGRPLRGRNYDDGSKVPLEAEVQRARRILEELRRRYGDTARSQMELDYIERLLKGY